MCSSDLGRAHLNTDLARSPLSRAAGWSSTVDWPFFDSTQWGALALWAPRARAPPCCEVRGDTPGARTRRPKSMVAGLVRRCSRDTAGVGGVCGLSVPNRPHGWDDLHSLRRDWKTPPRDLAVDTTSASPSANSMIPTSVPIPCPFWLIPLNCLAVCVFSLD